MDSPPIRDTIDDEGHTPIHEYFHQVQRRYVSAPGVTSDDETNPNLFGQWTAEAQAALVPDRMNDREDRLQDTSFANRVNYYLVIDRNLSLFEASYLATIFWAYCSEQMGVDQTNPSQGVDFVRDFWKEIQEGQRGSAIEALDALIGSKGRGSLEEVYQDFSIANYTHTLDSNSVATNLPDGQRYLYNDPNDLKILPGTDISFADYSYAPVTREAFCVGGTGCAAYDWVQVVEDIALPWHGEKDQAKCDDCAEAKSVCALCAEKKEEDTCAECAVLDVQATCEQCRFFVKSHSSRYLEFNLEKLADPCELLELRARACRTVRWAVVGVGPANEALFLHKAKSTSFAWVGSPVEFGRSSSRPAPRTPTTTVSPIPGRTSTARTRPPRTRARTRTATG